MQLVIWEPFNPLEKAYLRNLRRTLLSSKRRIEDRISNCLKLVDEVCKEFPEDVDKIAKLRRNLRYLSTGIATTESLDTYVDPLSDLSDSERHTLKVAYRKAASLAHPDKGGDTGDFLYVREAYVTNDVGALVEYVNYRINPDRRMIEYWNQQIGLASVRWEVFKSTPKYRIAQCHLAGQRLAAMKHAKAFLDKSIHDLEIVCFNQGMLKAVQNKLDSLAEAAGKPKQGVN